MEKLKLKMMNKIFILLMVSLASCSTMHKVKNVKKVSTDSTAHAHSDSAGVKKNNSVTKNETNGSWEKETVFEFDTISNDHTKKDYEPGATIKITPGGFSTDEIKAAGLTKVTIREKGQVKTEHSATSSNTDTAFKKSSSDVVLVKNELTKDKQVQRTDHTFFYIVLGLAAIACIVIWYYWTPISIFFLAFFKRRKSDHV